MFIRTKSTPNSPRKSIQVVEGYRADTGKVKQKIIRHVGIAHDEVEEKKLKALANDYIERLEQERAIESTKDSFFPVSELGYPKLQSKRGRRKKRTLSEALPPEQVSLADIEEEKRMIEGVHEVAGHVFDDIYQKLCTRHRLSSSQYQRLKDTALARLAHPCSKHKTQQNLEQHFDKAHHLDALYRMMDKVHEQIDMIKSLTFSKTAALFSDGIDVLLFDVTTLYFESIETDELRAYGYSKDHRFNTTQVVLALATNSDGLPVGYELFEGNKAEVKTLSAAIEHWRTLFPIDSVCFVGDRAMMSQDNVALLEEKQYQYVIAAKLKGLPKALQDNILDDRYYQAEVLDNTLTWVGEFEYKKQRLVVSYKPSRAKKDAQDRERIIEKLEKQLGKQGCTKKLVTNYGAKQYVHMEKGRASLDEGKIARAQQWDGLHGIITNIAGEKALELLKRYQRLWRIEESFRVNKHTLKMRPIFHFKPERIKAHVAICYMAFRVLRHLEYQVALTQKVSINEILETLINVQASIYTHKKTNDRYRVPGKFSLVARKIYKAFNLKRSIDAEIYMN